MHVHKILQTGIYILLKSTFHHLIHLSKDKKEISASHEHNCAWHLQMMMLWLLYTYAYEWYISQYQKFFIYIESSLTQSPYISQLYT